MRGELPEMVFKSQGEIKQDLHDIKLVLNDHKHILERNTEILEEHQRRSTASEGRLEQLEKLVFFVRGAIYVMAGLVTLALGYFKLVS